MCDTEGEQVMNKLPLIWQQCEGCQSIHEYVECGHGRWVTTCTQKYSCKRKPSILDRYKKVETKTKSDN